MYKTPFSDNWKYWKMWLVNVPSKKFKIAQFGALSPLTNQRTGSPNFSKEQSGESVHKLFKESMGEGSTKTVQRTNEIKIFLNNKFWMNVITSAASESLKVFLTKATLLKTKSHELSAYAWTWHVKFHLIFMTWRGLSIVLSASQQILALLHYSERLRLSQCQVWSMHLIR